MSIKFCTCADKVLEKSIPVFSSGRNLTLPLNAGQILIMIIDYYYDHYEYDLDHQYDYDHHHDNDYDYDDHDNGYDFHHY